VSSVFGVHELQSALDDMVTRAQVAAKTIVTRAEIVVTNESQHQLEKYGHKAGTPTPSPPGDVPASITGDLRRSMKMTPVRVSGIVATGSVYPSMVYARIQELGGDSTAPNWPVRPKGSPKGTKGIANGRHPIHIPARPYMQPAYKAALPKIQQIATEEWAKATRP